MTPLSKQKCVMIIAGEASGDLHGSRLVAAMRERNSDLFFCGIGGQALRDAGVKIIVDASQLSVVGISEVFSKMPGLFRGMSVAKKLLKSLKPDLLIIIDFPDFNLHIAGAAKKIGISVLYYISPQIWAWRPGRVKKIRKVVDRVAVILPFEEKIFKKHQIQATFVGHPLLDTHLFLEGSSVAKNTEDMPVVGFLPGSRDREIVKLLPVMLKSARILLERDKNMKFIVSVAPSIKRKFVETIVEEHRGEYDFEIVSDTVENVLKRCRLAVVASGTVTLEAAIFGIPMIIIYKVSLLTYWLGKMLVRSRVKNFGLVNLIAGREISPELLQGEVSSKKIADMVFKMLNDASGLEKTRNELLGIKDMLGGAGASKRVADIALNMLE
ncbi:MAG: lipid-A-disaccharide synthase [Deltaproteobacteria bacterium]|nr:lipid-A-disaccharide synthase [Deltaproteobacteria bacterium]MBW2597916.1 lipid-A-disaccharide synthase [Deltaproteobacteria bacterium]